MRILSIALIAALTALPMAAQQVGQNKSTQTPGTMVMSVTTQMVVEAVNVRDKQGNPVKGLTAKDFTVTEDGAAQDVVVCEYQTLPSAALPAAPPQPIKNEDVKIYRQLVRSQIAAEQPGDLRYKDRRLIAIYFDMSAMPIEDQMRALDAAQKFIRTQMTGADSVAILRYSAGSVDVLQDFTDNRSRLLSIIGTMTVGEGQGNDEEANDASTSDSGAAFGQDSGEFNIFNTDRQLSALQTAANMLGRLNEKKLLVYFSSGLRLNGMDNQAQLHATIDAAIRSGVSFWPIDARGLVANAPLGDATKGSQGNQGMYSGAAALAVTSGFQQSQDTLFALAGDTGGKALLDNNDLGKGLVQAQQSISSYYILGYYTTHTAQDGKFRKIKVAVNRPEAASIDFRQGYYAGKEFKKFDATEKERQLEDALMLNDPITDLTIAMEVDYFQLNRAEYFVPIIVKIPGRELSLAKQRGAEHTLIDFIGEIKDNYGGVTVANIHDKVNIKLTDATAQQLAKSPIEYDTGFTLLPGKYTIKFLARDDETGRIGTFESSFTIPNLNKETKQLPISAVVLSSQLMHPKDALFNAAKEKDLEKQQAVDPLVQNGEKVIPSVTRVFSRSRNMYVFLQAYEQGLQTPEPLVAYVSFYQNQQLVYRTNAIESATASSARLQTMPLSFTLGIDKLQPGTYICEVTVLDATGQKSAFWQAPIVVVP